ncbi:unnamed protein product [Camellia sinensis]
MEYNKRAFYGDSSSGSSSDRLPPASSSSASNSSQQLSNPLPPLHTLRLHSPPNSLEGDKSDYLPNGKASRIRSFPHVKGNYALYVYIPVRIPSAPMKELAQFLKKVSSRVPGLNAIDIDIPLNILCTDDLKLEQASLGREFHISLGRTVPIRRHQIDSVVAMLRQKLQFQSRYWIDFNEWEVFVNDDHTRSFLSIEVKTKGLAETILLFHTVCDTSINMSIYIRKQIQAVNEVYKLHNLPEFYKDPRPHVSLAWALGDISDVLKRVVEGKVRRCTMVGKYAKPRIFTCKFSGIDWYLQLELQKMAKTLAAAKSRAGLARQSRLRDADLMKGSCEGCLLKMFLMSIRTSSLPLGRPRFGVDKCLACKAPALRRILSISMSICLPLGSWTSKLSKAVKPRAFTVFTSTEALLVGLPTSNVSRVCMNNEVKTQKQTEQKSISLY